VRTSEPNLVLFPKETGNGSLGADVQLIILRGLRLCVDLEPFFSQLRRGDVDHDDFVSFLMLVDIVTQPRIFFVGLPKST